MPAKSAKRPMAVGAILIAMSLSSGCSCFQTSGPPPPDDCEPGTWAGVDSFEIGNGSSTGAFVPWMDGSAPTFTTGGQGSPMMVMRIRVSGANPTACLAQNTIVKTYNMVEGRDSTPRKTYEAGSGQRMTDDMYIVVGSEYDPLAVTTTIGALEVTRRLARYALPDLSASLDLRPADLGGQD
jgi:hypothetical protein